MRNRLLNSAVLLLISCATLTSMGCTRLASVFVSTSPDEVKTALRTPLQSLRGGQVRRALAQLQGAPVDAAVWERTDRAMAEHVAQSGGSTVDRCEQNLLEVAEAIELHRADEEHGYRLPERLDDLVRGGTLKHIPTCPAAGRDTYSAGYAPNDPGETYRLSCQGAAHKAAGLRPNNPRYEPRFGIVAQGARAISWWPAPYRVEVASIERRGDSATVVLKEEGGATVRLALARTASGGWKLASDDIAGEGQTLLGTLIAASRQAALTPAATTTTDGRETCSRGLQRVATALEEWSSDHDGRYPERLQALVPEYLPQLPACGAESAAAHYRVQDDGSGFELTCGGVHTGVRLTNRSSLLRNDARISRAP